MTKEELIKEFDEKFPSCYRLKQGWLFEDIEYISLNEELKDYIFNEIIPEILKSMIPEKFLEHEHEYWDWYNTAINEILKQAKENFWITL